MSDKNSGYLDMELLRFTTAGSVDDGKSTLIGRLLYDSKAIFEDQMEAIERASERIGNEEVNLALLTDGLKAEREQGITIDVAYRYFATPKRKFIIADTPGHIQYTRNMVTGASTANVAIILVDARHGVLEQTLRHSYIASLLQIPHIIFCVNKMDLVDYSEETFEKIKNDIDGISSKLDVKDIRFVPISALNGDNVVERSEKMEWYDGPTLLHLLENIHISSDINHQDFRFPVQYVVRPQTAEFPDYRGYGGRIASGAVKVGDPITVLPSGFTSKVKTIDFFEDTLEEAFAPQSVTVTLEDEIDISRGDMLVKSDNLPQTTQDIDLMVCWFNERKVIPRGKYVIRHTSAEARCMVTNIHYKMNINTLEKNEEDKEVGMNDIAKLTLRVTKPLHIDTYNQNRITGSVILVDEGTNETVAAGMIR
ncbi:sulfate adenylyltransferase subunit CysN [Plebeiibacterium marinum]|uniref:sulfate adenylyltransferase n=1 Tax=Plebeiibacterium marinum TaxID=2992111 RepID=A0AAE3MD07_9BACT|nr:sulfate adenylyltransferase subunit CysN [Plebeiobacterium marinum]MCW3804797.1 sulfate adenylyltransferase subunit CysN [Plebeiobacterium marinum]